MKLFILFTLFGLYATLDCNAQKKKEPVRKFPDVLAFDSSGKYTGTKRWNQFTTTKTLSISFSTGDTLKLLLQKLNVIGYFAVQNDGIETNFKVGRWQTVVPGTDNLRLSEGDYSLGAFKKCCEAGHCTGYYSYKTGYWKFYYSTEQLMACGTFVTVPAEINTGCNIEVIKKSQLSSDWKFYDLNGELIQSTADLINAIENYEILQ